MKKNLATNHPTKDDQRQEERHEAYVPPVRREKKARRSVLIADALADHTITIGGIFVIIAVLGILVFLVVETVPLFKGGTLTDRHEYSLEVPPGPALGIGMDDYKTIAYMS